MKSIRSLLLILLLTALPVVAVPQPPTPAPAPSPEQQKPPDEQLKDKQKREQEPEENPSELKKEQQEGGKGAPKEISEKKEEKWDVNNPPGPSTEVPIDVTEGTWMYVDVSPDGKEVAFDLLGDIYVIPIGGGEAKALTHDVAWQMQPRYSPDGKTIAFTSDQGGGDNIWLMNRDGSNPRAVTKESFRLLNEPAWTPDGEYIVARKHFTAQRSLGAGEMWLYHRSGGEGLQLTKKPNDQKDAGEPVFSPDGRYLYFSQDITPGPIFEYNKDPNTEIFVIQRLDRQKGTTQRFVGGPGGAVRPTPSPDGKTLAFIRRVRGKSVIHLMDLRSGEAWPIYDGLDRDMQETWSIHGVYPGMAWTPDSKSIVFWAGGKIRHIDTASKKVSDIPFHVRTTRKVQQALRYPVEVAPKTFETRMLRWVNVAPKGDRVVFQALGHLWIRDLPNGKPRRLTRQNDHWEYYPSFSRDGRSVVYTTWDDDKLGTVRVVPAGGGEGKVVVSKPGHYVEPAFTPDGKQVVYRRIEGGFLRTDAWSLEPGIYRVPAAGGEPTLITEEGEQPGFGAESDRVYLLRFPGEGKRQLVSLSLDGKDERQHLISENATQFQVSPDGRWVAFTERFHAYVMPFVPTGKAVDVGPKAASLPLRRVTRDAGEYLHWSGDSKRLHWSLGPELYTLELKNAFTFLEGAPETLPDPPASGQDIGFPAESDVPKGRVAVIGGRVITMRGDEVIEDGTVVVEGNRIKAVGPRANTPVPAGAYVVDAKGKTVIPGLIDVHWHGPFGSDGIVPQSNWVTYATLAYGVTTLHDPSNDTDTVFAASELQRAGMITAPRIFSTGTVLYGANAPFTATVDNLEDARSHLRRLKAVGAFSVKSYNQPRRDQRQQVLAAARELGMMVVPEGGSLFEHNMAQVVDGHTGVEHTIPVAKIYGDVRQLWKGTQVGYTPTLIVGYGGIWGENYWYDKTQVWENDRLLRFVPREILDERSRRRVTAPDEEYNHFNIARIATELSREGVKVNMGAHGQREGLGAHWEMWMLAQGGMTPMEVLRSATINGARYLGLDKDIGSLEPGKLADLVVLDADPLADIRNSDHISLVVQNGRVYDAMTLDQLAPDKVKRQPFFWQKEKGGFSFGPSGAMTHIDD
ncbi:MAG TPA: amidohydrolase family protein [Thermoanaerobaculia bacterium]|jgi:imidazolonepropionase-like amidohydrolase/Tol biopolymer transport system component